MCEDWCGVSMTKWESCEYVLHGGSVATKHTRLSCCRAAAKRVKVAAHLSTFISLLVSLSDPPAFLRYCRCKACDFCVVGENGETKADQILKTSSASAATVATATAAAAVAAAMCL